MSEIPALQKLANALSPLAGAAVDGPHQLAISGSINLVNCGGATDNTSFIPGVSGLTPIGGYFGPRSISSGNIAAPALSASAILLVDVRAGGAGGGVANLTVRGTANTDLHVGYASLGPAGTNLDGGAYMPVLGSVNVGGMTGSVNVTQGTLPLPVVGSVNVVVGTGSLNSTLVGVGVVDVRGSFTLTQWSISGAASGQFVVAGSAPANQRVWISSYHLISTGTIDLTWMSPSGVSISGSMRLLPGAGFALAGAMPNGPVLLGSQQSAVYINSAGTQNIGGIALGWVA